MQLQFDELEESFRTKRPLLPPLRFMFDWEFKVLLQSANLNHVLLRHCGRVKALRDEQCQVREALKHAAKGSGMHRELSGRLAEIDDEMKRLKQAIEVTRCEIYSLY